MYTLDSYEAHTVILVLGVAADTAPMTNIQTIFIFMSMITKSLHSHSSTKCLLTLF